MNKHEMLDANMQMMLCDVNDVVAELMFNGSGPRYTHGGFRMAMTYFPRWSGKICVKIMLQVVLQLNW